MPDTMIRDRTTVEKMEKHRKHTGNASKGLFNRNGSQIINCS